MPILFDFDPQTKISTFFDYDPISDKVHLTYNQDVSKILDDAKERRSQAKPKGKVESWAHYAVIPAIVEMELAKKGLKLNDKNATRAIIREIETNYPYCKVTDKVHSAR